MPGGDENRYGNGLEGYPAGGIFCCRQIQNRSGYDRIQHLAGRIQLGILLSGVFVAAALIAVRQGMAVCDYLAVGKNMIMESYQRYRAEPTQRQRQDYSS